MAIEALLAIAIDDRCYMYLVRLVDVVDRCCPSKIRYGAAAGCLIDQVMSSKESEDELRHILCLLIRYALLVLRSIGWLLSSYSAPVPLSRDKDD